MSVKLRRPGPGGLPCKEFQIAKMPDSRLPGAPLHRNTIIPTGRYAGPKTRMSSLREAGGCLYFKGNVWQGNSKELPVGLSVAGTVHGNCAQHASAYRSRFRNAGPCSVAGGKPERPSNQAKQIYQNAKKQEINDFVGPAFTTQALRYREASQAWPASPELDLQSPGCRCEAPTASAAPRPAADETETVPEDAHPAPT